MDPIVVATGTALVGAVGTDAWRQVCAAVAELWRDAGGTEADQQRVDIVTRDLWALREEVLQARRDRSAGTERALTGVWQLRIQALLRERPELAGELRRVLSAVLAPALAAPRSPIDDRPARD